MDRAQRIVANQQSNLNREHDGMTRDKPEQTAPHPGLTERQEFGGLGLDPPGPEPFGQLPGVAAECDRDDFDAFSDERLDLRHREGLGRILREEVDYADRSHAIHLSRTSIVRARRGSRTGLALSRTRRRRSEFQSTRLGARTSVSRSRIWFQPSLTSCVNGIPKPRLGFCTGPITPSSSATFRSGDLPLHAVINASFV